MARFRRFRRRRRKFRPRGRVRRRRRKRTFTRSMSLRRRVALVKPEFKVHDVFGTVQLTSIGIVGGAVIAQPLFLIAEGTQYFQRIGKQINVTNFVIRWKAHIASNMVQKAVTTRMMIIMDRQPSQNSPVVPPIPTLPTFSEFLAEVDQEKGVLSFYQPQNTQRFRVWKDFTFQMGLNSKQYAKGRIAMKFKKPLRFTYSGTTSNLVDQDNRILYLIAFTDAGTADSVDFTFYGRMRYTDA